MTREEAKRYIIQHCNPDYPKGEKEMMREITYNIDTIIVNPSEEERVRAVFLANGLGKFVDMIVPCAYVAKGQILAYDRERQMHLGFKIGENTYDI